MSDQEPRVCEIGEATVLVQHSARDILEILWNIALTGNPYPDPDGEPTQRLVHRLETALRLISDERLPREEVEEADNASRTSEFPAPAVTGDHDG